MLSQAMLSLIHRAKRRFGAPVGAGRGRERIYLPRNIINYNIENNKIQWQVARGNINPIKAGRLCQSK